MNIELATFYERLGTIFLIMVLGFFLGKIRWISKETNKQLVNLLLMVFMPAALFTAFPASYNSSTLDLFLKGLLGGVVVMLMLIVVSKIIFNKKLYPREIRYESQFGLIFNNATFLGYPIVVNTFGPEGVVAYCGFIIAFNIALFSYGIWLFEHKLGWHLVKETVTNPNIIAVLLGMVLFLLNIHLPTFVSDAVGFVGSATTPLSVICVGLMLSWADFRTIFKKWRLLLTAAVQLIVGPILTYVILSLMKMPMEVVAVCTLIEALPTATSLSLFAAKYDGNEIESSELVAISTLFSVVTMPIMVGVLLGT